MAKFRQYDKYEVYEDGKIFSYISKKFLKPETTKNGYQRVALSDNEGNIKRYLLHRIVYETFSGSPIPNNLQCNHISEDKMDNRFCNINLLTPKENTNWGTRNFRASKSQSKQVGAFKNGKLVMTFQSIIEARRNGFHSSAVSRCCRSCFNREGNNVYKGYEWRYL